MQVTVGGAVLAISPDGVDITGKLTVKGGITARDDVKASNGSISLAPHSQGRQRRHDREAAVKEGKA